MEIAVRACSTTTIYHEPGQRLLTATNNKQQVSNTVTELIYIVRYDDVSKLR